MSVFSKLRVKSEIPFWLIDAPEGVVEIPAEMSVKTSLVGKEPMAQVLVFAKDKKALDARIPKVTARLAEGVVFWIAYPKKSGAIKSDISRDYGWEAVFEAGYEPVTQVAIDENWSALRFKKSEAIGEKLRDIPMEDRKIEGVDFVKRTVQLPKDARTAMKEFEGLEAFFNSMSFSHKKENVEAIVEAKKPETRQRRIGKMIEMVLKMKERKENKEKNKRK